MKTPLIVFLLVITAGIYSGCNKTGHLYYHPQQGEKTRYVFGMKARSLEIKMELAFLLRASRNDSLFMTVYIGKTSVEGSSEMETGYRDYAGREMNFTIDPQGEILEPLPQNIFNPRLFFPNLPTDRPREEMRWKTKEAYHDITTEYMNNDYTLKNLGDDRVSIHAEHSFISGRVCTRIVAGTYIIDTKTGMLASAELRSDLLSGNAEITIERID